MKAMERRLTALETKQSDSCRSLDHLTDEELEQSTLDLIQRFADAGVALPDDWRAQYDRSCIRFLEWLGREAKELALCVD